MRADIKYLATGLFIGLSATALLLTGMLLPPSVAASLPTHTPTATLISFTPTTQPSPTTHPPTNTFTPTPTLIRLKTETSTNTPTFTPTVPTSTRTHTPTPTLSGAMLDLLESGYLSQTGPLSLKQQFQVYGSSLKFIRKDSRASRLVGEEINGKGYGSPSDICGPLSIVILQDAGLINPDLNPHDFWLLNPDVREDRRLLARTFPPEQFENTRYKIKLNKVDWSANPLQPGDFIYTYAGTGGNFEHMLVVNRVDSQRRAYAVTNYGTPDGFIIDEVLLYDPNDRNAGIFHTWTEKQFAELGSTGFGGFELWRLRSP